MKNNQTVIAGGVLAVLAILYFVTQTGAVDTKSVDSDAFAFEKDAISSIDLTSSGSVLSFVRNDLGWTLEDYPVDTTRMNEFIDLFAALKLDRLITKNPEKHIKYEVAEGSSTFQAKTDDGKELLRLFIGKQGANYQETFVREIGKDQVFAVKASLSSYKEKTQTDFWDRTITQIDVSKINHIEFSGEFNYIMNREGSLWTFNGEQVDYDKVVNMLQPLENLQGSNFASGITLDNVFYQNIILSFEDGQKLELTFHQKDEKGALVLVQVSGNNKVFEYSKAGLNRYKKELSDLIADPPPES